MAYQDRTLSCVDCGSEFIFTAADQEFHAQKGYANEPKRCPSCRSNRRAALGGRPGGGGGGGFGDNREWSQVTCSRCGQQTQVPFVPRTDRPVYCSDCFSKERAGSGGGGGGFGGGGRSRY